MNPELPEPPVATSRASEAAESSLPPSYSVRWGLNRKAMVVEAIDSGLIRLEEALDRYRMSVEEYHGWRLAVSRRRAERVRAVLSFGRKQVLRRESGSQSSMKT